MNYSASEAYHDACREFSKRSIAKSKICKRWFRNHYVYYESRGYFNNVIRVFEFGEFNPDLYVGECYGPFWNKKEAEAFAHTMWRTHENFILN